MLTTLQGVPYMIQSVLNSGSRATAALGQSSSVRAKREIIKEENEDDEASAGALKRAKKDAVIEID
jgi:hypothetical protein